MLADTLQPIGLSLNYFCNERAKKPKPIERCATPVETKPSKVMIIIKRNASPSIPQNRLQSSLLIADLPLCCLSVERHPAVVPRFLNVQDYSYQWHNELRPVSFSSFRPCCHAQQHNSRRCLICGKVTRALFVFLAVILQAEEAGRVLAKIINCHYPKLGFARCP